MMRSPGSELRANAIEALQADPEIGPNVGNDRFLHVAGVSAGSGLDMLEPWLRGLLHRTLLTPGLDRSEWAGEVARFLDVLSVRKGSVPCTIRSALTGITVTHTGFELDDAIVRPAVPTDFLVPIGRDAPEGVVFEYRTPLPAFAGPIGFSFPDDLVAQMESDHRARLTHFLLAVALTTEAPIQEQLVMKAIDFEGGGSGGLPEEIGPIAFQPRFLLDEPTIERIRSRYRELDGSDLSHLAVATRRFLMARTERVRPTDQIIDYAIGLESMSSRRYADKQGKELARLLADDPRERKAVESDHETFRAARERIVHDGAIPSDASFVAQVGRELVRKSLWARSRP